MLLFTAGLARFADNIPNTDDYDAGLHYLLQQTAQHGLTANLQYFLAAQQNEYKIYLGHAVIWLQYAFLHHVDFRWLDAGGDLFIPLIALLLWRLFLPQLQNRPRRLALFIPVLWLLFQLEYSETLNWPLPVWQNITVVFFVLLAICWLDRDNWLAFVGALLALVLAIGSSGNGFFLVPVGALLLLLRRRWVHLVLWIAIAGAMTVAYAYHYTSSTSGSHNAVLDPHRILYVVAFLGSALPFAPAALLLGPLLCGFFVFALRTGYIRRNPSVGYSLLFIGITAIGVAGIRSHLGLRSSMSSRYRIYSDLLLIFAWFFMAERWLLRDSTPLHRSRIYRTGIATAILLSIAMDAWGVHYLTKRHNALIVGMRAVERGTPPAPRDPTDEKQGWTDPQPVWRAILDRTNQLGIYTPPTE